MDISYHRKWKFAHKDKEFLHGVDESLIIRIQVEHVRLCCLLCLLYLAESGSSQRAIAQEKAPTKIPAVQDDGILLVEMTLVILDVVWSCEACVNVFFFKLPGTNSVTPIIFDDDYDDDDDDDDASDASQT